MEQDKRKQRDAGIVWTFGFCVSLIGSIIIIASISEGFRLDWLWASVLLILAGVALMLDGRVMMQEKEGTATPEEYSLNEPIIQVYSPQSYHGSAAVVMNELGRRKLAEALQKEEKETTIKVCVEDGEGFRLGIFVLPESEIRKMQYPYLHEWGDTSLIDPREEIDKKIAKSEVKS